MNVLILFQSMEGHTRSIVNHVRKRLGDLGHEASAVDLSDELARFSFEGVDRVILAGPVHERRHPRNFEVALAASKAEIEARPGLFLSVSLSAAFPDGREEAQAYIDEMLMRTDLSGLATLPVAGAVQAGNYDYFETQVLRHIVLHDRDYEVTGEGEVFTDWGAIDAAVDRLMTQ